MTEPELSEEQYLDPGPVFDPETGEVLAVTDDEREALVQALVDDLVAAKVAQRRASRARALLDGLLSVGDARLSSTPGWAVMVKPATPPKRAVVPHALDAAAERLAGNPATAHLAPREETVTRTRYPGVGDLTSTKARAALALLGLTPEQLLHVPPATTATTLEVVGPDE